MKKYFFLNTILLIYLTVIGTSPFILTTAGAKGIKTSYKRYSIFKYKSEEVLCEPYIVTKDDWLYKIFRKKGEISEKDFPHFLLIFKELNPQISNIDAIEPGISILIPLKKVQKKDYDLSTPDNVDVPVIEFSTLPEDKILEPFIKKHKIKQGENISSLMDKEFLEKGGQLSEEGLKAFQLANPNIQNINIIYEGAQVYLPDPAIKSQPWFQSFFTGKPEPAKTNDAITATPVQPKPPLIDALTLLQLKKYSSLIGGTLLSQGKMYFPGKNGENQVMDLSRTPVIETKDGQKILVMSGINQNDMLLEKVQEYWEGLRVQMMAETIQELRDTVRMKQTQKKTVPLNQTMVHKTRIKHMLSQTSYDYIPDAKIPFMLNNIHLEASFGRIIREDDTDLLINFGNVYGNALEVLKKKEFKIISITPKLNSIEVSDILFSNLGYSTWENPSFFTGEKVESISGLYAVKDKDKLFIPEKPLTPTARQYLKTEDISLLSPFSDSKLNSTPIP